MNLKRITLLALLLAGQTLFAEGKSKDDAPQDPVKMYQNKAERTRQRAAKAEGEEAAALNTLAANYDRMAAIKQEAADKSAKGEPMDWSEYHRLEGENMKAQAAIRKEKAGKEGGDKAKEHGEKKENWKKHKEDGLKEKSGLSGKKDEAKAWTDEANEKKAGGFQIKTTIGD